MKFKIDKLDFMKTLQKIQGIVEKRTTMPILSNVSITAAQGVLNIMATDLEVFIKDTVKADVAEDGDVTVNARKLFEIVKELPQESVSVSSDKNDKVTVKAGKAKFGIMGLPAKDFPVFPTIDENQLEEIESDTLKDMIDKTSFAVSTDETRYNINGFLLEKDNSVLRMVATDGHRLALIEKGDVKGVSVAEKHGVLLPRKGVMEFRRLLEEKEGNFLLGITEKNAVMKKDDTIISTRLLEGEFPDYNKVVPSGNDKTVEMDRAALLASLKRVSILSTDKVKGVKFNFAPARLVVSSSSPEIGEATEELSVDYEGEELEISFNARYFIDMLEAVGDEKTRVLLKDSLSPGIVRPVGTEGYTYIIMPMRL